MPAPSYAALYDFPDNVAAAAKAVLVADMVALIGTDTHAEDDAFIFGPRENLGKKKDCIDVTASPFTQASDQQVQATSNNEWFFAHYSGQIMIKVQTPRAVAVAAAMHGSRVGRILFLHQPIAARYTSTNLPYYEITDLRLASQPLATQDEELDVDQTELVFNVGLWIFPSAFPAVVP
jgi:hypothetical protein